MILTLRLLEVIEANLEANLEAARGHLRPTSRPLRPLESTNKPGTYGTNLEEGLVTHNNLEEGLVTLKNLEEGLVTLNKKFLLP